MVVCRGSSCQVARAVEPVTVASKAACHGSVGSGTEGVRRRVTTSVRLGIGGEASTTRARGVRRSLILGLVSTSASPPLGQTSTSAGLDDSRVLRQLHAVPTPHIASHGPLVALR